MDSFDTHARIPEHFAAVDAAARAAGTTALISTGWDPGLFSLNRLFGEAILASGDTYTFWGKGLSQGHSDAVRRVDGVAGAVQYTIPSEDVHFITAEELARDHRGAPHGGFVIRSGESSPGTTQTIEYRLQEESNPGFSASVLVAYARAAARLAAAGEHGARTPFDVAPGLLSPKSPEQLRAELL